MKEGWEYKRIGDICTVVGGSTPKTEIKEYWGGENYWVTPAELNGDKYQGATSRTITDLAVQKTNLQLLPAGTVLLSSRAPIGKVAITTVPMYCNQGFKNIICPECLLNDFVYWYLFNKTEYLNSLGTGATFKEISKKTTENISIPVPPIAEQQRIVAELDLLTGIIDKQTAQLKELDMLAKSSFHKMFGNPIENDRGWQILPISKISSVITGNTPSRSVAEYYTPSYIEWIKTDNITSTSLYPSTAKEYLSSKGLEKGRPVPEKSLIVTCIAGSIGSIGSVSLVNRPITINQQINAIVPNELIVNSVFLYALIRYSKQYIQRYATNGMKHIITKSEFEKIQLPIPDYSLQTKYASILMDIESQKASINRSIAETRKLFDYTMDKYFG